jgi:hypothetical protein
MDRGTTKGAVKRHGKEVHDKKPIRWPRPRISYGSLMEAAELMDLNQTPPHSNIDQQK